MLILHTSDLLAEAYAARLLASLAGVALEIRHLDIHPGRDHETDAFRVLSPLGRLPVLEGAGAPLADWQAVLCAIATRGDTPARADAPGWWRGADPAFIGWLGMARDLAASAGVARLHEGLGVPADGAALRAAAHALLREVERHLWFAERAGQRWLLAGEGPCAAD
ncbi:MAG TPA: glutathione S-transferase family protein, partial [Novosphingobium sp.]|nr:glutathione S-transferase family protein [Novosphingobium sp.]